MRGCEMSAVVKRLEQTSGALREAMIKQDWNAIGQLDQQCREVVDAVMMEPSCDQARLRESLQVLLEVYRELVAVCHGERGRLAGELRQAHNASNGARVYKLFG
jgi:flagellar protein FliT